MITNESGLLILSLILLTRISTNDHDDLLQSDEQSVTYFTNTDSRELIAPFISPLC